MISVKEYHGLQLFGYRFVVSLRGNYTNNFHPFTVCRGVELVTFRFSHFLLSFEGRKKEKKYLL